MRQDGLDDFRNDVATLLDQDAVAGSQVFARDIFGVMERGHADCAARKLHRFEHGVRCHRPGAADVHLDRTQRRGRLFRRELERRRPPGKFGGRAQLLA
jgi:hypothetical protein